MDELLRAGFAALGLPLDAAALARFQTYYTLLDERSKVMNLTAIHGETDVAQLHFLDSAALLTVATMYPYLKHRIPEIREENAAAESDAQHASVGRARGGNARGER